MLDSFLRSLRVGIYGDKAKNEQNEADVEYNAALEQAISALQDAGAVITRDVPCIVPESHWKLIGNPISKHEFKSAINSYLKYSGVYGNRNTISSLKDIVEFNEAHKDKCLKYGQNLLIECQEETSGRLIEPDYIKALRYRETAIKDFDKVFTDNNFDILILASQFDETAPLLGFPSGTIPFAVRENDVPMGMYFIARRFDEVNLIRAMYAAEQLIA